MNRIKRLAGIIWMVLGPLAIYYLVKTALAEIARNPLPDIKIQWAVFVIIFIPIVIGLVVFGWFAFRGEYDHLPESSSELED